MKYLKYVRQTYNLNSIILFPLRNQIKPDNFKRSEQK